MIDSWRMALDRYGVLVGTLASHHRDRPDAQGRWFHVDAAAALDPLLAGNPRVLVYGEASTTGLGMHNIHQNQGDPAGSRGGRRTAPGRTA